MSPRRTPVQRGMELLVHPRRALVAAAVFAAFFVAGSALGEDDTDDRAEPARVAVKTPVVDLGGLRLEPAAALPDLRMVRREPPRPKAPERSAPTAAAPSADPPADVGAPPAVEDSPPAWTPPPSEPPAPQTDTPPPPRESTPEPPAPPAPDPAPAPAPSPSPDPSPNGGSGQYQE
jgi:outer membrane biosynthesis protein TonB